MRKLILAAFTCSASVCWADKPVDAVVPGPAVHLNSAADLAQLHKTNPDHYARAVRLISSASRLCDPGAPKLQNADGRDISCAMLLLTSYPPKRALSFTLDGTPYVAIVTITADRPQLMHADQR
ncbi:MAG TPA: hypothetical protein VF764_11515 [Steroidobacteraceae bacterium]